MGTPVRSDRLARLVEMTSEENGPALLSEIVQRMADGEDLYAICAAKDVPGGQVLVWLAADEKRMATYRNALALDEHRRVLKARDAADAGPPPGDDVRRDGLRLKAALDIARLHFPAFYGDAGGGAGGVTVVINRGVNRSAEGSPTHGNAPLCEVTAGGRMLTINEDSLQDNQEI